MRFPTQSLAALVLCCAATTAHADLLTVDADPSSGADFDNLRAAYDAAVDGDVLLLAPGAFDFDDSASSGTPVVWDKSVTIAADYSISPFVLAPDPEPTTDVSVESIGGLPAGRTLVFQGIRFVAYPEFAWKGTALDLVDNAGAIVLDHCAAAGIRVLRSSLSFSNGDAYGVPAGFLPSVPPSFATPGMWVQDSVVRLSNVGIAGGSLDGVVNSDHSPALLIADDSEVVAVGSSFRGAPLFPGSAPAGASGVELGSIATFVHRGCTIEAGAGTVFTPTPITNLNGTVIDFGGEGATLSIDSVLDAGETFRMRFSGPAASVVFIGLAPATAPKPALEFTLQGSLALALPLTRLVPLGVVGATGSDVLFPNAPQLAPGGGSQTWFAQAFAVDAAGQVFDIGSTPFVARTQ